MKVIAGDLLQYLGCGSIDRHLVGNDAWHLLLPLAVNEDRDQLVAGVEGSFDHTITLGHKDTLHVAPSFTPHPQGVIA